MKVYIVWDPLYERVVSVHSTEAGANAKCVWMDENDPITKSIQTDKNELIAPRTTHCHEFDEFELED